MDAPLLAFFLSTLRLATPLCIAALGELITERAGVLNIGIEGMMLCGALAGFALGVQSGSVALGSLAAVGAGVAGAALFGFFVLERRADPIVCGAALNLLALGITGTLYRLLLPAAPGPGNAPQVTGLLASFHPFALLALVLALASRQFVARTRTGLAIRASGERAEAAYAQGIQVRAIRWACTLWGGALAGLAGGTLVLWLSRTFVEGMTSGRGFIALALVLFGGYQPLRIVFGALLFGAASALQYRLQAVGLDLSYNLLLMTPYVLTLVVLTVFSGRVHVPGDLGRSFYPRS